MYPHVQPMEWDYLATESAAQFDIKRGDRLSIQTQAAYAPGDLIVIERAGRFYLRRYHAFCRNLAILGKVVSVNDSSP